MPSGEASGAIGKKEIVQVFDQTATVNFYNSSYGVVMIVSAQSQISLIFV